MTGASTRAMALRAGQRAPARQKVEGARDRARKDSEQEQPRPKSAYRFAPFGGKRRAGHAPRRRRGGAHKRRTSAASVSTSTQSCTRTPRHPASAGRRSLRDGGAPRKRRFAARPIFGRRSPVILWPRPKSGTLYAAAAGEGGRRTSAACPSTT